MKKAALLIAVACFALPAAARADNTVCAGAIRLVPDGSSVTQSIAAAPAVPVRYFHFTAGADRSYALMLENPTPSDAQALVDMIDLSVDCAGHILPVATTVVPSWNSDPVSLSPGGGAGRWSILSGEASEIFFDVIGSSGGQFVIRVEDTTQINTFFSTFSGFNTFYRLANTTAQPLTVRLKMINDAGTVVRAISFSILGSRSAPTRNTTASDLNIPANTGGFAIFTHDGPPGALALDGFLMQGTTVLPIKIVDARQRR
jgi:hypothetical protein